MGIYESWFRGGRGPKDEAPEITPDPVQGTAPGDDADREGEPVFDHQSAAALMEPFLVDCWDLAQRHEMPEVARLLREALALVVKEIDGPPTPPQGARARRAVPAAAGKLIAQDPGARTCPVHLEGMAVQTPALPRRAVPLGGGTKRLDPLRTVPRGVDPLGLSLRVGGQMTSIKTADGDA